jgi:hypothetical protein
VGRARARCYASPAVRRCPAQHTPRAPPHHTPHLLPAHLAVCRRLVAVPSARCAAHEAEVEHWLAALQTATGAPVQSALGSSPPPPARRGVPELSPPAPARRGVPELNGAKVAAPAATGASAGLTISTRAELVPRAADGATPPASSTPRSRRKPINPHLFTASRPMHKACSTSMLSGLASGGDKPTNLTGFINLIFLLFVLANARLILENLLHHGLLLTLPAPPNPDDVAQLTSRTHLLNLGANALAVGVPPLLALAIERAAVRTPPDNTYRKHIVNSLHAINILLTLVLPCALVASGLLPLATPPPRTLMRPLPHPRILPFPSNTLAPYATHTNVLIAPPPSHLAVWRPWTPHPSVFSQADRLAVRAAVCCCSS